MRSRNWSFLMAVLVASYALFWAQINAPTELKPLTNQLLKYPGQPIPSLKLDRGIYRLLLSTPAKKDLPIASLTKQAVQAMLPQQALVAKVVIDSGGERSYKPPAKPPKNTKDKGDKDDDKPPTPVVTIPKTNPAPTPPPPSSTKKADQIQDEVYQELYGDEKGRYGYKYADGSIAGTYVTPTGEIRNIAIPSTIKASNDYKVAAGNKIASLTDQDILDLAKSDDPKNTCAPTDTACQKKLINETLDKFSKTVLIVDDKEIVKAIADAQQENSRKQAEFQEKLKDFMDPSKSLYDLANCDAHRFECNETGAAKLYLESIGVSSSDIDSLIDNRNKNITTVRVQTEIINKFLTKTNEELRKEYCGGSVDACERLLNGGILEASGIDPEKAQEIVKQKQAAILITNYQSSNLVDVPVPTKQIGPLIAAQEKVTERKENEIINSGCIALGGTNCSDINASLNYLADLTGSPDLTAAIILSNKMQYKTDSKAYENISNTLVNLGQYDKVVSEIEAGNTTWTQVEKTLDTLREDNLTNLVVGWNDFTGGRFKRGNDLLLASVNPENNYYEGLASIALSNATLGLVTADTIGSNVFGLEGHIDRGGAIKGSLIQGGDAAMVVTTAVAAPLAAVPLGGAAIGVGATGFLGTGFGIATSTQMIGTAVDACEFGTEEACRTSVAIATISVGGTGLGLLSSAAQLTANGATVGRLTQSVGSAINTSSSIQRSIQYANLATEAIGAITFSDMAYETCNAEGVSTLDCASSIAMAAAASGKLVSSSISLPRTLNNITNPGTVTAVTSTANVVGNKVLEQTHNLSAGLFFASACSKIFEGPANVDETAMCAMGMSGLAQPFIANADPAKSLGNKALELAKSDLVKAQERVRQLEEVAKGVSGSVLKDVKVQIAEAKTILAKAELSYESTLKNVTGETLKPIANEPIKTESTAEKITVSLSKLQDGKSEIPLRQIEVVKDGKKTTITEINVDAITNPATKAEAEGLNKLVRRLESDAGITLQAEQVQVLVSKDTISQLKAENGESLKGKTAVITRILSVSEPRTMVLTENATSAKAYIDTAVLSESGKKFYGSQKSKVIVIDAQNGFREVDMTKSSFEVAESRKLAVEEVRSLLESSKNGGEQLVFVGDYANSIWTRLGGNESTSLTLWDRLVNQKGLTPEGILMKEITQNKQGEFLFVGDEISSNIYTNYANSGTGKALSKITNPALLGGVSSGKEAISIHQEANASLPHQQLTELRLKELESGKAQSDLFLIAEQGRSVPKDINIHGQTMADIITQSLAKTKSSNTEIGKQLENISTNLRDPLKVETALKELDSILSATSNTKSDLLTDLNFRKSSIQEDWNQLARIPGTEFAQEGRDLVLRKKESTSGERLSSATQLISFYEKGKLMLEASKSHMLSASDVNTALLPKTADITISPKGSQMTVRDFLLELQNAGHKLKGLDATPQEAINALNLADKPIETVLKPSSLKTASTADTALELFASDRASKYADKASVLAIDSNTPQVESVLNKAVQLAHEKGAGYDTIILAQNKKTPNGTVVEEFIQFKVVDGKIDYANREVIKGGSEAWNNRILEFTSRNPEKLMIAINVERGLDLNTSLTLQGKVKWSEYYDGTGTSKPTSVNAEQLWRRDRTFEQETHDMYLVTEKSGLTKDNVWQDFFVDNLNTKLAEARFQDTLGALGKAPEKGLSALESLPPTDLKLNWLERIRFNNLKIELAREASSYENMLNSSVSRKPLSGEELYIELYTRAKSTNEKLLSMAERIGAKLNLSQAELNLVKARLGATDNFVSQADYLTKLAEPTKQLSKPNTTSPNDLIIAFASNNSSAASSDPRFKVVAEQHLSGSNSLPATFNSLAKNNNLTSSPTLLTRAQEFIKNITTPKAIPTSLATLTDSKNFTSFSTEDDDGNILRILKDSSGNLIFEEANQDTGVSSTREFNMTDLDLFPPASLTRAVRYNNGLIPTGNYSRNAIVAGLSNAEALQNILDSDGFSKLGVALTNGDTLTLELLGNDLVVNTKTKAGRIYSETPSSEQLKEMLKNIGDEVVAITRNGEDVPLMTYLSIPKEKSALAQSWNNFTTYLRSPASERTGGINLSPTNIIRNLLSRITPNDGRSLEKAIQAKNYQAKLNINPEIPFKDNSFDQIEAQEWASSQSTPKTQQAAKAVIDNITHISQKEFELALAESVNDFNEKGDEKYVTLGWAGKSNKWVFELSLKNLKHLPEEVIDASIWENSEDNPDQNGVAKLIEYLKSNPDIKRVALFDDAIYSARQLSSIIESLQQNGLNHVTVDIVSPFMTSYGEKLLTSYGETIRLSKHQKMRTVSEAIPDLEIQKNILKISDFVYINSKNQDQGNLNTRTLTYFDHKVADNISTLGFQNLLFIPKTIEPYTGARFTESRYNWLVSTDQASTFNYHQESGLSDDESFNMVVYNYQGKYVITHAGYSSKIYLVRGNQRTRITFGVFLELQPGDIIEQPQYSQFEAPDKPAISLEFTGTKFRRYIPGMRINSTLISRVYDWVKSIKLPQIKLNLSVPKLFTKSNELDLSIELQEQIANLFNNSNTTLTPDSYTSLNKDWEVKILTKRPTIDSPILLLHNKKSQQEYVIKSTESSIVTSANTVSNEIENYNQIKDTESAGTYINPILYVDASKSFYIAKYQTGIEGIAILDAISPEKYAELLNNLIVDLARDSISLVDANVLSGHNIYLIKQDDDYKLSLIDHGSYKKTSETNTQIIESVIRDLARDMHYDLRTNPENFPSAQTKVEQLTVVANLIRNLSQSIGLDEVQLTQIDIRDHENATTPKYTSTRSLYVAPQEVTTEYLTDLWIDTASKMVNFIQANKLRTTENMNKEETVQLIQGQIQQIESLRQSSPILPKELIQRGKNMIHPKIQAAYLAEIKKGTNPEDMVLKFDKYRIWDAVYDPKKLAGLQKYPENIQQQIISALTGAINKHHPNFIFSTKDIGLHSFFLDLDENADSSIARMSDFLEKVGPSVIQKVLANNKINVDLSTIKMRDYIRFGLSQDPTEPLTYNVINGHFAQQLSPDDFTLHGALLGLVDLPTEYLNDDYLPILYQTKDGVTPEVTKLYESKKISLQATVIKAGAYPANLIKTESSTTSISDEDAASLTKLSFGTYIPLEEILKKIPVAQRDQLGRDVLEVDLGNITVAPFALDIGEVNEVQADLSPFSQISQNIKDQITDLDLRKKNLEGFRRLNIIWQTHGTNILDKLGFGVNEYAGDGFKAIYQGELTGEMLKAIVDLNQSYDLILDEALVGKHGPDAKLAAEFIRKNFPSKVYVKVGLGKTNAKIILYPGSSTNNFIASELITDGDVAGRMTSVKKYKGEVAKNYAESLIGISKEVSDLFTDEQLAQIGLKRITDDDHGIFLAPDLSQEKPSFTQQIREFVTGQYLKYRLTQWKNRAGSTLSENQKDEIITILKNEPNSNNLLLTLVNHRRPNIISGNEGFTQEFEKVNAFVEVTKLASTIKSARPLIDTHNLMNNLFNEYSKINFAKIEPYTPSLSQSLLSNDVYATTEFFKRVSDAEIDLKIATPQISSLSQVLSATSRKNTWVLLDIIGSEPSQYNLDNIIRNLNFAGNILRSVPTQKNWNKVIQDRDLANTIHAISENNDADKAFSQSSKNIVDLVNLSRKFNRRSQYYYSEEIIAAGLKSGDQKKYIDQLNGLSAQEANRFIATLNRVSNLGEYTSVKKTKPNFDRNIIETVRIITLDDQLVRSFDFIDKLITNTSNFVNAQDSYTKKSLLLETLKIITPEKFNPDRILEISSLLASDPNATSLKTYPKLLNIWKTLDNDDEFIIWFNEVKTSPNFMHKVNVSNLQPKLSAQINLAINNLTNNFGLDMSKLIKYDWDTIAQDYVSSTTPQSIIDLSKNMAMIQEILSTFPGNTGEYLLKAILTINNPSEIVGEIAKHPELFRPLFSVTDDTESVSNKLKKIISSDSVLEGIKEVRQNNLRQKMAQMGFTISTAVPIPASRTYKLIQILDLYKHKNVSAENEHKLSSYIAELFPQIPQEQLFYLTGYGVTQPHFLLFLTAFKNELAPYFSQTYSTTREYSVASASVIDLFFTPASTYPDLWNTKYVELLSNNSTLTKPELAIKIITQLTDARQIESAWSILQKNNPDQLIPTLSAEQQRFWQTFRDYPLLQKRWLEPGGVDFFYSLQASQVKIYTTLAGKIDESPVAFIQKIKEQLIAELLEVSDPVGTYENIDKTLTRNNLPEFIKLIKVFNYLYPKASLDSKISSKTSPIIQNQSDGMRRLTLQFDLFHAAVESGNRNLENYLTLFNNHGNLVEQFMQGKTLNEQEIKQITSFILKMDAIYRSSNLTRVRSGLELNLNQVSDQAYLRTFIQNTLYADLYITPETRLVGRIEELFLHNTGYTSLDSIISHMRDVRSQTTARNLAYATSHPDLILEAGDLTKAMVKEAKTGVILGVLENGPRARELMGDLAGTDATPLDTDLSMATVADAEAGYETAIANSVAEPLRGTTYGRLVFVTKNLPGRFYRSDLGETTQKGIFELFVTGVLDKERHAGIRGAYPSSYFDAIINNGFSPTELETLYQSITLNGFYIPVYSIDGKIIFTPEMYTNRLKFFAGVHEETLSINHLDSQDEFAKLIEQQQLRPNLIDNAKDIKRVESPVRDKVKKVLAELNISLADDPSSANLTDAILINIGSSGRGTNLPKDYDFDYSLILNRQDYKKAPAIAAKLRDIFPHTSEIGTSTYQIRLSEVAMVESGEILDLDIGIVTREDSLLYSSNQAVSDRLESLSDSDREQAVANILLAKKLLKEGHAYKAFEEGGFGGIGVENWVLANNGNIRQAFESFYQASHDKKGNVLTIDEFRKNYPLHDPGTNLRNQGFDNYTFKLNENGYQSMLKVVDQYISSNILSKIANTVLK